MSSKIYLEHFQILFFKPQPNGLSGEVDPNPLEESEMAKASHGVTENTELDASAVTVFYPNGI